MKYCFEVWKTGKMLGYVHAENAYWALQEAVHYYGLHVSVIHYTG